MSIQSQPLRSIFVGPTNGGGCKTKTLQQLFLIIYHLSESLSDQNLSYFPPNISPGQEHVLNTVHSHLKQYTQKYSRPCRETGATLNFFSLQETQIPLDTWWYKVCCLGRCTVQIYNTGSFQPPLKHCPCSHTTAPHQPPLGKGTLGTKSGSPLVKEMPTEVGWTGDKKEDIDQSHLVSAEALH